MGTGDDGFAAQGSGLQVHLPCAAAAVYVSARYQITGVDQDGGRQAVSVFQAPIKSPSPNEWVDLHILQLD
jgi:hypothetical protein